MGHPDRLGRAGVVNWRNRVLRTFETLVQCIGNPRTTKGLTVPAQLDATAYPTAIPSISTC